MGDVTLTMHFGKHTGQTIEEIPSSYLRWMLRFVDDEDLLAAAETEIEYRTSNDAHFEEGD